MRGEAANLLPLYLLDCSIQKRLAVKVRAKDEYERFLLLIYLFYFLAPLSPLGMLLSFIVIYYRRL